jgi:hypothetical protein
MSITGYKVAVDEVTIHKAVRKIVHPITGEPLGHQNGNGETFFLDEVVAPEDISPDYLEALEDENHPLHATLTRKLVPVSDEPTLNEQYRLGLPFDGYDDMDEDEILAAMGVLPSAAVVRIVQWEQSHENRPRIAQWNIGYQETPLDRQEGNVPSAEPLEDVDNTKPVRNLVTRAIPDDGPVRPGEGITGTGDPAILPGEHPERDDDGDTPDEDTGPAVKKTAGRTRRSRRTRADSAADKSGDKGDGGGSGSGNS